MKTYRKMRQMAWDCLWKGRWLGRFVSLLMIYAFVNMAFSNVLGLIMGDSLDGITAQLKAAEGVQDAIAVLAAPANTRPLLFALVFNIIFNFLYTGLYSLSIAFATLRAVDGAYDMKGVFGSFRMPIGVWWLAFLKNLVTWWPLFVYMAFLGCVHELAGREISFTGAYVGSLLVSVLCLVRVYRFRMAWFVKAENPDYGAAKCLMESARVTHGAKWRNMMFDCSYWGVFTVLTALGCLIVVAAGAIGGSAKLLAVFVIGLAALALGVFAGLYVHMGQAVFYRELKVVKDEEEKSE